MKPFRKHDGQSSDVSLLLSLWSYRMAMIRLCFPIPLQSAIPSRFLKIKALSSFNMSSLLFVTWKKRHFLPCWYFCIFVDISTLFITVQWKNIPVLKEIYVNKSHSWKRFGVGSVLDLCRLWREKLPWFSLVKGLKRCVVSEFLKEMGSGRWFWIPAATRWHCAYTILVSLHVIRDLVVSTVHCKLFYEWSLSQCNHCIL